MSSVFRLEQDQAAGMPEMPCGPSEMEAATEFKDRTNRAAPMIPKRLEKQMLRMPDPLGEIVGAGIRLAAATGSVESLVTQFKVHAESAATKDRFDQLTPDEATAILLFAGVPYDTDFMGKLRFKPASLTKRDGKWTAIC